MLLQSADLEGAVSVRYFNSGHGAIVKPEETSVLEAVAAFIEDPVGDELRGETEACSVSRWKKILVLSPAWPHIYDEQGRHTGPANEGFDFDIPGVRYEIFGDTKSVILPHDGSFRIVVEGESEGTFDLKLITYSGEALTETIFYTSVPTSPGAQAEVVWDDIAKDLTLKLDQDGDGTFEDQTQPSSILGPHKSLDEVRPTIEITSPQQHASMLSPILLARESCNTKPARSERAFLP